MIKSESQEGDGPRMSLQVESVSVNCSTSDSSFEPSIQQISEQLSIDFSLN